MKPPFVILKPRSVAQGLTLIELIMFILIVSVALVGVLSVMNITASHSADPMVRKQVVAVAEGMMDEILAKDYAFSSGDFAGPYTPANRASFDTVDDYNGWNQTGLTSLDNSSITGLEAYTLTIAVVPATVGGTAMKEVTVSVSGGGESFVLHGYRANYQ